VARLNTRFGAKGCDGKSSIREDPHLMTSVYYCDGKENILEAHLASRFGVPNMSGAIWIEYDYEEATRRGTAEVWLLVKDTPTTLGDLYRKD